MNLADYPTPQTDNEAMDGNSSFVKRPEEVVPASFARTLEQQRDALREALEFLMEMSEPPEKHCTCHLSPPCGWCVDFGGVSEAHENARAILTATAPAP